MIPAKNEEELLPQTLKAVLALPEVCGIVVVDDASTDNTGRVAEQMGATVIRRSASTGKGAALTQGADHCIGRSVGDHPGLLFLDADAADSAVHLPRLLAPVMDGTLDMAIAIYTARGAGGGHGRVVRLARDGINSMTGWAPTTPLSGIRAMTAEAYLAVRPLAARWGVETALTIDAFRAGLRVDEVQTDITHRATGQDWRAKVHRGRQYVDVQLTLRNRHRSQAERPSRRPNPHPEV
ncbi:MAG: glycosyltransferase family 2 protein [Acidimicrobiales bacterium]